jgi:hypothetical protein
MKVTARSEQHALSTFLLHGADCLLIQEREGIWKSL